MIELMLEHGADPNLETKGLSALICAAQSDRSQETLSEASVTGAKGVGEGGTIGAPAAVLNAVPDALAPCGVGIFEMPITPQRILQLLREAGSKAR
jgi:hypothetical protein